MSALMVLAVAGIVLVSVAVVVSLWELWHGPDDF